MRRFELAWYSHGFLRELVLIYPVYAIMMGEQGISPAGLSALLIIWTLASLVFEVPSGALADRVSRRDLMLAADAIKGCAFLIWLAWPAWWGYALGFVVWTSGSSLASGTKEALLHDALVEQGRAGDFERVYGRLSAAENLGCSGALLLGGWLAESGYTAPLLLSALAPWLAGGLFALGVSEPPRSDGAPAERYLDTLRDGARETWRNPAVLYLVLAGSVLAAGYGTLEEYVGPFLDDQGFSLGVVGTLYAVAGGARALGVWGAHAGRGLSARGVAGLFAASALALVGGVAAGGYAAAAGLSAYFLLSGAGEILLQGRLQRAIDTGARATVTSIASMVMGVAGIGIYVLIGGVAEASGWAASFAAVGALTLVWALVAGLAAPSAAEP